MIKEGEIGGHDHFTKDAVRAYQHAVAYAITGDNRYVNKVGSTRK